MRALVIYVVILAFLSLNPWFLPDPSVAIGYISWDKIEHAVAYCGLSLLLILVYKNYKQPGMVSLIVLLACSLVGILLEYFQFWFTSNRMFSYGDAGANVFGAVLGVALFWCYWFVAVCGQNK
ncbi:MAG: VanZ family protein [Methylococcales bacterium]|nr:VanZ family protein [Methylococcales bacterium]MDD5630690.1 VanZ family protein [Methylococcales bacterium]